MITCAEEYVALDDVVIIYGRHLQIMPAIYNGGAPKCDGFSG